MHIAVRRGKGMDLAVANAIADPVAWEQFRKLKIVNKALDLERMK